MGAIGTFLRDKCGEGKWVAMTMAILSANPVVAAATLSAILFIWIAARAFLAARTFTVLDVFFDRSDNPKVTYKLKARVVLRNNTNRDMEIGRPTWMGGAAIQPPFASCFRVEGVAGWESGGWQGEV